MYNCSYKMLFSSLAAQGHPLIARARSMLCPKTIGTRRRRVYANVSFLLMQREQLYKLLTRS